MTAAPRLRILHAPTSVGGHPQSLARAERGLGLASRSVVLRQNHFGYPADEVMVPRWLPPRLAPLAGEAAAWLLTARACVEADVVHLNYGGQLAPTLSAAQVIGSGLPHRLYRAYSDLCAGWDLRLIRRAGVGLAVTFQGDDARQGDVCRQRFPFSIASAVDAQYYTPAGDAAKRAAIARIDRLAQRIFYLNPDLGWVLPARARFVPYANIDPREWRPTQPGNPRPLVLHAPTHRAVKGTAHILAAVEELRGEGLDFDFRIVEGLSHTAARQLYEQADLLIDQLLAGWYGGLAVELMALGKPVICHLRESDFGFLPAAMRAELPLLAADPASLTAVLRRWLTTSRAERAAQGLRARAFVERWHDPRRIAAQMRDEYHGIIAELDAEADLPCAG